MKNKIIFIPENLDLEQLTINKPPNFEFDYEYAYFLVYEIIKDSNPLLYKIKDWSNFYKNKSVKKYMLRRSSTILQQKRHDYSKYINYLYFNNILWRDNYSENVCRGYQLAPEYFGKPVKFIKLFKLKNIKLTNLKSKNNGDYSPLNKWFDNRLSIEIDCACKDLNSMLNIDSSYYDYIRDCIVVSNIYNGNFNYSRKRYSDDRLHSEFTRFPKKIRKYLRYDNQILGEVDISSSVPFFLYYHLLALIDSDKINKEEYLKFFKFPRLYSNALKKTKALVKLDSNEVEKFGLEITRGNYYSQFLDSFNDDYYSKASKSLFGKNFNFTQEEKLLIVKKNMLSWANAREKSYKKEQEVFKQFYPSIHQFLTVFKKRRYLPREGNVRKKIEKKNYDLKKDFQQHKKVAHLLLQSESYFMLEILAKRLNKSKSKIPFFTLHDCIVTIKEKIEELNSFMIETFKIYIGFSPNFKTKILE
jgi:hypothetical protein